MSQENVELVRKGYEAFERGEVEAVLSLLDPDAEIRVDRAFPDWKPYYGHGGFISFMQMWLEPWETYRIEIDELIDADERVLVVCHEIGRRKDAVFEVVQWSYHVWTLKNGQGVRLDAFFERAEALEAVGLSEQDAHAES